MRIRVAGIMKFAILLPGDVFKVSGCGDYYIKVNIQTKEDEPNALNLSDNVMYKFCEDDDVEYRPSVLTIGGVQL